MKNYKLGFTLAEVLITLGIIGIVAAITMPSIINNFKRKELESRFKKASAIVETALVDTMHEYAMENLLEKRTNSKINNTIPNNERQEMNNYFESRFANKKALRLSQYTSGVDGISDKANRQKIYSYKTNTKLFDYYIYHGFWGYKAFMLADGTTISPIFFQVHDVHDGIKVVIDTNGPFKGPNRYGYDIFIYSSSGDLTCNDSYRSYGCYHYAQADENPNDKNKGYWESLY